MSARDLWPAAVPAVAAVGLALPAGAGAQEPPPAAPPAAPAPPAAAPAPAAPAAGRLALVPERVGGRRRRALVGSQWRVRGAVRPFVAGQQVVVRFYRRKRKLRAVRVAVQRSRTGRSGAFVVGFASRRPGRIVVRASHRATAEQRTFRARPVVVRVAEPSARPGSRGPVVRLLQARLASMGYVVGARGRYDERTARAVLAFRKVVGMPRTLLASAEVFRRLGRGHGRFRVRFPGHGKHVEVDLSRQVLALIRGGRVERLYPTSTGSPATPTILGSFRVYRKDPGTNAKGMVQSSYFIRGYAIHGYPSVPIYPASHGCVRVAIPEALTIFSWLSYGDRVDVYS
jgi:L,D-transpeptidase-like protein/putative peptidoglycan binding protein